MQETPIATRTRNFHRQCIARSFNPRGTVALCYGPTRVKMSGDALPMKITCSGGDVCRCRTCGPTRKLTRDVLTNLRGTFGEASPIHRRLFGDDLGNIRGLIGATSANS